MARRYHILLGVSIGLVASAAALSLYHGGQGGQGDTERGPLLSDCHGAIRELVIHYVEDAAEIVLPTYRELLRRLPAEVTVRVVCPNERAFDDLLARVGPTACRLSPVIVDHAITAWSRDRWLALGPARDGAMTLLCPRAEDGAGVWPARAGDQRVAADLAAALAPGVISRRSDLYFDGGDFMADSETAFVHQAVLLRNLQRTVQSREELIERLSAVLQRRVLLMDDAPDHHVGMFLMPVGQGTVLLGDPGLAERLLAGSAQREAVARHLPGGADFTAATIARFEAVARQCRSAGYRVVRIPLVPGVDGRTYITYVNAILDERDGRRIVYMPTFDCAETLNRAATEIWTELGFDVRPIPCDGCSRNFGALHCLVNVLRRGD